jgi:deaminated glutathione amidase
LPNGETYRESATYNPGEAAVAAQLPDFKLGFAICYDMRFPRLANALANAGCSVLTYPAAFTVPTGQAHWHVLLRCRAIETGSFVLAAAQGGMHDSGRATYGHSIAISPWGEVLAEAGDEPGVLVLDIDLAQSAATRARIPALVHARDFALPKV